MKTLLQATIDGYSVVTHIGTAAIDPMATQLKIGAMLTDTPEWPQIVALETQIAERRQAAVDAFVGMFKHSPLTLQTGAEQNYWLSLLAPCDADVTALNAKTIPLRQTVEAKKNELWTTHAVYSVPAPASGGGREDLITDEVADGLQVKFDALTETEKLTVDGSIVPDLRGKRYWFKSGSGWTGTLIAALGQDIPKG